LIAPGLLRHRLAAGTVGRDLVLFYRADLADGLAEQVGFIVFFIARGHEPGSTCFASEDQQLKAEGVY